MAATAHYQFVYAYDEYKQSQLMSIGIASHINFEYTQPSVNKKLMQQQKSAHIEWAEAYCMHRINLLFSNDNSNDRSRTKKN